MAAPRQRGTTATDLRQDLDPKRTPAGVGQPDMVDPGDTLAALLAELHAEIAGLKVRLAALEAK